MSLKNRQTDDIKKRKQEEKEMKQNLKRKKRLKFQLKELDGKKIDDAQKETLKIE